MQFIFSMSGHQQKNGQPYIEVTAKVSNWFGIHDVAIFFTEPRPRTYKTWYTQTMKKINC